MSKDPLDHLDGMTADSLLSLAEQLERRARLARTLARVKAREEATARRVEQLRRDIGQDCAA